MGPEVSHEEHKVRNEESESRRTRHKHKPACEHPEEWSEDWLYTRGGLSGKTERGDATLDQWTDDDSERRGRLDKNAVRQGANDQTCR